MHSISSSSFRSHLSSCRFLCTQNLQRSRPSHMPLQQALGEEFPTFPPATPPTSPGEELSTFPPATPPTSPGEGALNLPTCHSSQQALGRSSRPSHLPLLQQALGRSSRSSHLPLLQQALGEELSTKLSTNTDISCGIMAEQFPQQNTEICC